MSLVCPRNFKVNFSGPVEDLMAIRGLLDTFADASTREDQELWASCWADDSSWILTQGEYRGKQEIVQAWVTFNESYRTTKGVVRRITLNHPAAINVAGENASGRIYFSVATYSSGADEPFHFFGIYNDEYSKILGKWLFKSRTYQSIFDSTSTHA